MEKFHRFEIEYVMNNSISFYYQLKKGCNLIQILTHREQGNSNIYYTMPENVGRNARHQFSVYANSNIAKIWHTNNSLNFIAGHEKVNNATEDIVAVGFNSTNQISIGEKAAVNINMEFRTKTKTVNYIYNGEYCIDLGAYYRFNKNLH